MYEWKEIEDKTWNQFSDVMEIKYLSHLPQLVAVTPEK